MKILEKIESDFKQALKKRDTIAISTLRMLKADLHNKEIENKGKQLDDGQVCKVVARQVKQHRESIEQFKKGKREELAEKETQELAILKKYLPEQLSPEEITNVVKRIIQKAGASSPQDFGKVMKMAILEFKGKADGKLVSQIVSDQLKPSSEKKEN